MAVCEVVPVVKVTAECFELYIDAWNQGCYNQYPLLVIRT